ncbi:MAG: alpha/beta fold hydrolase [Planctomycetota bacterium]
MSECTYWANSELQPAGASLRLFCFPHAGGFSSFFRFWKGLCHPELAILPVRLPGRETMTQEPSFTTMSDLLDSLVKLIGKQDDQPFAFFGHSFGGLIAFALAHRLVEASAMCPTVVFVSASRPPNLESRLTERDFFSDSQPFSNHEFNRTVKENSEFAEFVLPGIRSDIQLSKSYRLDHGVRLETPLVVLGGASDHLVQPVDLIRWQELCRSDCTIHIFKGGHFFVKDFAGEVLSLIRKSLAANQI